MVVHPESPFAHDVQILLSELCIVRDRMETLLIENRFFERFGKTVNRMMTQYRSSPRLYSQITRYCSSLKELKIRYADPEGL